MYHNLNYLLIQLLKYQNKQYHNYTIFEDRSKIKEKRKSYMQL